MAFDRIRSIDLSGVADPQTVLRDKHWPPKAMSERAMRMKQYRDLYDGEWASLNVMDMEVQVNLFRAVPVRVADILSMSEPTTGDDDLDAAVSEAAYQAVVHMLSYGGAVYWTNPETGLLEVLDPRWWFPTEDGWMYGVPLRSPVTGLVDRLQLRWQYGEVHDLSLWRYAGGALTDRLDRSVVQMPDTAAVVANRPLQGNWGTSVFDDLASPCVELSHRETQVSAVLDKFVSPPLAARVSNAEMPDLAPDITDDDTFQERQEKVGSALTREFGGSDVVTIPDQVQSLDAVVWDPRLGGAMDMVDKMETTIEMIVKMPGLFNNFAEMAADSGISMKRKMWSLYAVTQSTQVRQVQGANKSLAAAGVSYRVDWPHPFDVLEDAAAEPGDTERIVG